MIPRYLTTDFTGISDKGDSSHFLTGKSLHLDKFKVRPEASENVFRSSSAMSI